MIEEMESSLPPYDLVAEHMVLNTLVQHPEKLDSVADKLKKEHFYSETNARVYAAMLATNSADIGVVSIHLKESNGDNWGPKWFTHSLDNFGTTTKLDTVADVVVDKASRRVAIASLQTLVVEGRTLPKSEYAERIEATAQALIGSDTSSSMTKYYATMVHAFKDVEAAYNGKKAGTSSGIESYDTITGGLHPGDLTVLAARPGMGKTSLAIQMAMHVNASVVFSLEMPSKQLVLRDLCSVAGVDQTKVRNGFLSATDWADLTKACERRQGANVWIDDWGHTTIQHIRMRTKKAQSMGEVKLVIVDHIGLVRGSRNPSTQAQVSEYSRDLKALAKELNVSVVALSQLNRNVESREDKHPVLSDLRDSGALEQDADNVVFLYRDSYYTKKQDDFMCEIMVAKHRNGPLGVAEVMFDPKYTRFFEKDGF